ncbi:MAG: hypothetical protein IJ035_09015 [Oscillospiraceae bacterium]|nr:hypothetical protein [Oscillospiraceae bacterium]
MKKTDLINQFDSINADENIKQKIWNNVSVKTTKATPKLVRKPFVIAAAVVCVLLCSLPVVADSIKSLLNERFPETAVMQENIQKAVYESNDGHVKMTVDELLSDEMIVLMTVHYEALDEKGKEWINNHKFESDIAAMSSIQFGRNVGFGIVPDMGDNTIIHGVNVSYNTEELTEYKTDTERWFLLHYEASSRDYDSAQGKFAYPMTSGVETVYLDTRGNVPVKKIELKNEQVPSEYFTPTHIEISKLSFVIFAMQYGIYETFSEPYHYGSRWILPDEEYEKIACFFVTENGERIQLSGGMNATHPDERNSYSDLVLLSNQLPENVDVETIVGLEINGIYYDLT